MPVLTTAIAFFQSTLPVFQSPYENYRLRGRLPGHSAPINRLSAAPHGVYFASGGMDGVVKIWNFETMKLTQTLSGKAGGWRNITALKWIGDVRGGIQYIIVGTGCGRLALYIWVEDQMTAQQVLDEPVFIQDVPVDDVDLSVVTRSIACSSGLGELRIYLNFDGKSLGTRTWKYQVPQVGQTTPRMQTVSFRGPGSLCVCLLETGQILNFDVGHEVTLSSSNYLGTPIGNVAYSADGQQALVHNPRAGRFDLYVTANGKHTQMFHVPGKTCVKDAALAEGGCRAICPGDDGYVYVFKTSSCRPIQTLRHGNAIRRVAASTSEDSYIIFSASTSNTFDICVWIKLRCPLGQGAGAFAVFHFILQSGMSVIPLAFAFVVGAIWGVVLGSSLSSTPARQECQIPNATSILAGSSTEYRLCALCTIADAVDQNHLGFAYLPPKRTPAMRGNMHMSAPSHSSWSSESLD